MQNSMVMPKMSLLPVLLTKQEVPAFSRLQLINLHRFQRKGASRDVEDTMVKPKMSLLPVLLAKLEVPTFSCL